MIKKFDSHEEAIKAGYPNPMGKGEYGQGGEIVERSRYKKLFEAIGGMEWNGPPFELPDFEQKIKDRFPDGVIPTDTPFFRRISGR